MAMRTFLALIAFLPLGVACNRALADGDGRAFGDDLGRFGVSARLEDSTCGVGAMDAPEVWDFDVILSKKEPVIYWNTGAAAVEGELADDGLHFRFSSEVVVDLGADPNARITCTIVRRDTAEGDLDEATDTQAFEGMLEYHFAEEGEGEGDCAEVMLDQAIELLPCDMSYRMAAERTGDR